MKNKAVFGQQYLGLLVVLMVGLFLSSCSDNSRPDCADATALNYNNNALGFSDCTYASEKATPRLIAALDSRVRETSGLALVEGNLITHNDRNNTNHLFSIDPGSGEVINTFRIAGAENHDWEDLAQSDEHLFIGDFGNNHGDRKDLKIYIIHQSELDFSSSHSEVGPGGLINFHYPEQNSFDRGKNHNWDAEALIYFDNSLFIFMKHRTDKMSNLYKIPAVAGDYEAELIGTFKAGHRITGGDISPDGSEILLVGYNKEGNCVLWQFWGFEGSNFLSGEKKMIELGLYAELGQMEAVKYIDSDSIYISAEAVNGVPARLYLLNF